MEEIIFDGLQRELFYLRECKSKINGLFELRELIYDEKIENDTRGSLYSLYYNLARVESALELYTTHFPNEEDSSEMERLLVEIDGLGDSLKDLFLK